MGCIVFVVAVGVVEVADDAAEGDAPVVKALRETLRLRRVVRANAVVVRIQRLDEIAVQLLPQHPHLLAVLAQSRAARNDLFSKMQVDEARGRELRVAPWEGGSEGTLVVVVAVRGRVIFAADVDYGVAG